MLASTTGSDATTIVLRRRLNVATGGKSFRGIPSPPWVCSLCDDGVQIRRRPELKLSANSPVKTFPRITPRHSDLD
jgi:hypothetical protein